MESLFQRNFLKIRNEHIIPLLGESKIEIKDYEYLKLKNAFIESFDSISNPSTNDYSLRISKKIIDKSRISEIEKFYLRAHIQQNDFLHLSTNGSPSWMVTTQYYRFYFLSICLHRILNAGYIWLNEDDAKTISSTFSTYLGSLVSLGSGNYRYLINPSEDPLYYNVFLTKQGANMHQDTWQETKRIFNNFIQNSKDEERFFLENLKRAYNSIKNFSPSSTRNQVNYSAETSLEELNKQIICDPIKFEKIQKTLMRYNSSSEKNNSIKLINIFSEYIDNLINRLLFDLYQREKKSCKLILSYQKKFSVKILKD